MHFIKSDIFIVESHMYDVLDIQIYWYYSWYPQVMQKLTNTCGSALSDDIHGN